MTACRPERSDQPRWEAFARYRTTCEACGRRVEPGSAITLDGTWVHSDCFHEREAAAQAVAEQSERRP
jgi:hypothetical protein